MTQKNVSRRKFLKGAGVVAAGAGASALAACAPAAAPAPTAAPAKPVAPAVAAPVVLKGATINWLGGPWSFLPELDPVINDFAADWGL